MTNAAGETVKYYLYEPFGKTLYDVETTDNDFQFVGQLGVRRMGSEDPIGLAGGDGSNQVDAQLNRITPVACA